MSILQVRLDRSFEMHEQEYTESVMRVLRSGQYILGYECHAFENEFRKYIGTKHAVGVGSGLDALRIAFWVLGIGAGDEVIVQSNAFIACVMGITHNNAIPIFVEPDEYYNIDAEKIEAAITSKTKAILVVHLYGQASNMERILQIAERYNLKIIEDCAQSQGAKYKDEVTGSIGAAGCFSFFPVKNLGAFGDAGAITLNDKNLDANCRIYRQYGSDIKYHHKIVGTNSRIDEIQAALLRVRLRHLDEMNTRRKEICRRYLDEIKNPLFILPKIRENCDTVWHQFVVRVQDRDRCAAFLDWKGVKTLIHYPIPPHLSEAYAYLGYKKDDFPIAEEYARTVLSLPLYIGMTDEEQGYVIDIINSYE